MGERADRLRKFAEEEEANASIARSLGHTGTADSEDRMAQAYRKVADELESQGK